MKVHSEGPCAPHRRAWAWAISATALVLAWQALTVTFNYGGRWTGLFCIGAKWAPSGGAGRNLHTFPNDGYDGQFYRLVARDPLLLETPAYRFDSAQARYQRILVPLAAWILALGQPQFIDAAYIAVVALFLLLGVYCCARIGQAQGTHPLWGGLFVLLPASLVSLDRMTVEVAITALAVAAALAAKNRPGLLWIILALAALNRETGLLLVFAAVAVEASRRRWKPALLLATSSLPLLLWLGYMNVRLAGIPGEMVPSWLGRGLAGFGILARLARPVAYPGLTPAGELVTQQLDRLALLGLLLALGLAVWTLRSWSGSFADFALLSHLPLFLLVNSPGFWVAIHGWVRPFGPLFALLLIRYQPRQTEFRLALLATLVVTLRVAAGSFWQVQGVAAGALAMLR